MKEKRSSIFSGWLVIAAGCSAFLFIVLVFAGTAQAALSPSQSAAGAAAASTATATPSSAATGTPSPDVAALTHGFDAWCAPTNYVLTKPTGPQAPNYARKTTVKGDQIRVSIPAAYCVLTFKLDQPLPKDAVLTFYDGKNPFLRLPLTAVDGDPNMGWTTVKHTWVVNPPKWSVSYQLSLNGPKKEELWSNRVSFVKPAPKECRFGGTPNPVTLWCTPYDRWETEPQHPDAVWHFDRTKAAAP